MNTLLDYVICHSILREQTNLRFKDCKHKQDDKEEKIDCYNSNVVNVSFCILIQNTTFWNERIIESAN